MTTASSESTMILAELPFHINTAAIGSIIGVLLVAGIVYFLFMDD